MQKVFSVASRATEIIRIEGEKGSLNEMPLDGNGKNPFERGQLDTFVLAGKDVGKITNVSIRHDNTQKHESSRTFEKDELEKRIPPMVCLRSP